MSKHDHGKDHHAGHAHGGGSASGLPLHKKWQSWVVVGLMLLAMVAYVLSMDEEIVPGEPLQPEMPAAAE
jgi:hypothetical protein